MVNEAIRRLVEYGLDRKLIHPADGIYVRNQLLMVLHLDDYAEPETVRPRQLQWVPMPTCPSWAAAS